MAIEYIPLGDTNRIGASAHYLRLDDWGILLDAGLDPGDQGEAAIPDYERIQDQPVNAIIISHAHLDHLGSLPVAIRYFPHARVYMTPATAALSEVLLFHYIRVRQRQAAEEKVKLSPLFSASEVENILFLFQSFDYNFPFKIHGFQESQIEIRFWDAGHILGSAGVEINYRGRKIFYTGNTKSSAQFIMKGAKYPASADVLITETTYGADSRAPLVKKQAEIKRFSQFLNERLNLGGAVLIPVFALGRTQEVMMLLHRLIRRNKLPAVPVYLTGFGIAINKIYDRLLHKIYPDYDARLLRTITYDTLRGKRYRRPSIILATSGMMLPNTLSYEIAAGFLTERRNGIAFVGWADPETPGGSLRQRKTEKIMEIFGVEEILCSLETFYFSAHAHREELLKMIGKMKPGKTILCHGEQPALEWMREQILQRELCREVVVPEKGNSIVLW